MKNQRKPETRTVTISMEDGNISYDKLCVFVEPEDTIEWACENDNYHFAVHIGWDSPLRKGRYRATKGKRISDRVPEDARPGRYKYFVAVFDGENIWTDDPEFIVKPGRKP
jgi:plastocyanin